METSLYVVGLGPGNAALLTPQAACALEQAEVIVGYTLYVDLVPPHLLEGKEVISTGMMGEMKRCGLALDEIASGKRTAMVCSGDPGIYAMAGLVYELMEERDLWVETEIIPGVSALSATAALLGAPLMHDFATISLSDLMTPWDVIEKRLSCAAEGDFVIAIYNPKSKKRNWQLDRALELVCEHQPATIPVGVVRNAYRENQEIIISTLGEFDTNVVDMLSTVIIGNASTRMIHQKMVTPRGYMAKYR